MTGDKVPSEKITPITITVPVSLVANDVVHVPLHRGVQAARVYSIEGYLRALVSGTFTIEFRDMMDDAHFATITWTQAGDAVAANPFGRAVDYVLDGPGSGIKVNVTSIGVSASDCNLIIWARMQS